VAVGLKEVRPEAGMNNAAYGATWWAHTMVPTAERPALKDDLTVDVCVVGGGLAGLTTAYELAHGGCSVALLEAEKIACKASGLNGGIVIPGFARSHEELIGDLNEFNQVRALSVLSESGVNYISTAITNLALPAVNPVPGVLIVRRTDDLLGAVHEAGTYEQLGTQAQVWDTHDVRALLHSEAYHQGVFLPNAFHIHPLNYAIGLSSAILAAHGRVFENSPVLSVDLDGPRKRIRLALGSVSADTVVLCEGAAANLLLREAQHVMPLVGHIAVTEPIGAPLAGIVGFQGGVFDTRNVPTYYRIVGGDRLLWGGPCTFGSPERHSLVRMMQADISKDYRQLTGVGISHVWSGTMAWVGHRMPVIDQLLPGVWILNGFGGHGLNTTAMAGKLVADALLAGNKDWRRFEFYKRGKAPRGLMGRLAAYGIYRIFKMKDSMSES
jgi:gamma-glutamylputrescine oxidase